MSKKNKKETVELDTKVDNLPVDEELLWEGLKDLRSEVANTIVNQQVMAIEMSKQYAPEIAKKPKVGKIIEGLVLSLEDLAMKVSEIDKSVPKDKTGAAIDVDDKLLYLNIASNYINILETITSITSSTHLEIHTALALNVEQLKKVIEENTSGTK